MSPVERRRLPGGGGGPGRGGAGREEPPPGSPLLRRRRGGGLQHQASTDSYYSFASEGDGDIFASMESLGHRPQLQRQASFCLPDSNISQYSEFNEDFHSSISELFSRRLARLGTQGTFSEQGSLRSLSIDQEELQFEGPGAGAEGGRPLAEEEANIDFVEELPFEEGEEGEGYISSSCSISMSSDLESSHQITVPVFIEPAPPELRFPSPQTEDDRGGDIGGLLRGDHPRIAHQEQRFKKFVSNLTSLGSKDLGFS